MQFTSHMTSNGVSEPLFTVGDIPGVLWSPTTAYASRPLVLLAHGGGAEVSTRPPKASVARPLGLARRLLGFIRDRSVALWYVDHGSGALVIGERRGV